MSVLLGSKVGIEALSGFLIKSGAFSRTGTVLTAPFLPLLENEPDPNLEEFAHDDRDSG